MNKAPNSMRNLDKALHRLANNDKEYLEIRTLLANIVVCQMCDDVIVKGGSSLKLRFGDCATRYTNDLDAVLAEEIDKFENSLRNSLETGWCGFSGYLKKLQKAHPKNISEEYVMQPYEVKIQYLGKSWGTVRLEVTPNEIDDAEFVDEALPKEAVLLVESLGFSELKPIKVMNLEYQIAQKLHGLTEADSDRGHDLIDLQLICKHGNFDVKTTKKICIRLFAYRQQQAWPTLLRSTSNLSNKYLSESAGLDVIKDFDDALEWVNDFIKSIANS